MPNCGNIVVDNQGRLLQTSVAPDRQASLLIADKRPHITSLFVSTNQGSSWESTVMPQALSGCTMLVYIRGQLQCYTQIGPAPTTKKPAVANATVFSRATSAGAGKPWSALTAVHSLDFSWDTAHPVKD